MMKFERGSTRQEILFLLKIHKAMSVDELSSHLGITPMGVRQHLTILEKDGLIRSEKMRGGMGRPSYIYSLTEKAENLFPKHYDDFAKELLQGLYDMHGEKFVEELLEHQVDKKVKELSPLISGNELEERVKAMVKFLEERGSMPSLERAEDGSLVIHKANCALHAVSREFPILCAAELELFSRLLKARVVREKCMAHGDDECLYRIFVE